ncbi:hypothetical protein PILCRDRAFT_821610, partial [Piloderma croceum F 1598]
MIGIRHYGSANTLHSNIPSPRDDLESLAYTILSLLRSDTPWDDRTEREEKLMKSNVTGAVLFHGLPREFGQLFDHARELQYGQQPNYQFLKGLLRSRASALGVRLDAPFNPHVTSTRLMELVTLLWPTIVQDSGFDDTNEEDGDDDGIGPDWDGYMAFMSWLLQDGVPEQDLFGDENKMLKGKVVGIGNPPAPSERESVKEATI